MSRAHGTSPYYSIFHVSVWNTIDISLHFICELLVKQYITQFEALFNLKCSRQCRYWQKKKKKGRAAVYESSSMFCGVAVTRYCDLDHNYSMIKFKEGKEIQLLETKLENLSNMLWVSCPSFYKESQMLTKTLGFQGALSQPKNVMPLCIILKNL